MVEETRPQVEWQWNGQGERDPLWKYPDLQTLMAHIQVPLMRHHGRVILQRLFQVSRVQSSFRDNVYDLTSHKRGFYDPWQKRAPVKPEMMKSEQLFNHIYWSTILHFNHYSLEDILTYVDPTVETDFMPYLQYVQRFLTLNQHDYDTRVNLFDAEHFPRFRRLYVQTLYALRLSIIEELKIRLGYYPQENWLTTVRRRLQALMAYRLF